MKLIIIGPQGSGKGTQAALISEAFGIPIIAPGEIFRNAIRDNTVLGKKLSVIVNSGKLVPDSITNRIIKLRLSKKDCRQGAILDGYPRRLSQAKILQKYWVPDYVIFLDISKQELVKRLKNRLVCVGCRLIFRKSYKPSEVKDLCDSCGGKIEKRKDETPAAISTRLKIYRNETVPVIGFYKKLNLVRKIQGEQSINKVWQDIKDILK